MNSAFFDGVAFGIGITVFVLAFVVSALERWIDPNSKGGKKCTS